jgi:flavodoxin/succinate dehydrogenase/fumarate reductase-like Fe-S protein
MSEELPLLILFGSQSGNAEDLASKAAKQSKQLGLSPTVKGMDEIQLSELPAFQRVLIYCSTWGEGEQPDNAEDLWQAASADDAPSMQGCHFAVCALGDTSYEFFCESGKEWDGWFEKQGAKRLVPRIDCDVDYDKPAAQFTTDALSHLAAVGADGSYVEGNVGSASAASSPEPQSSDESSAAPEEVELVGEGVEELLTSGDRSLDILFGSQSGNSEALAAKFAKQAKSYGLEGTVHDMDGFDFNSLSSKKRVIIVCSTWGEGEQPDNAEELWQFANSDAAARMDGIHFAVCALGDTSYEFFCESGKEWDRQLENLGASRIIDRLDCDVDYDAPAAEWALDALPSLAAVDSTGLFHEDMVDTIKQFASGSSGAEGEDGFSVPSIQAESIQVEMSVFRYDPETASTGNDSWACVFPGQTSVLEALRAIKATHDGSLTFRDGTCDDPSTAISVNGRLILPGRVRIDSVASPMGDSYRMKIEPIPGSEVIRDLVVDHWALERKRESSEPWMVASTREGFQTSQGVMGTMKPATAARLHSLADFDSAPLLHASSDAVPYANGFLGPAVIASSWARRCDPRTAPERREEIEGIIGSKNGIKAETDLAPISRRDGYSPAVSEGLLEARTNALENDSFNGLHGKHVWWYCWTVKSSGKVNDTVLYRQVLGPIGLLGNLFSGVTARMVLGFTRTGGSILNDILGMVAPPAGIGKMPRQFNSSVDDHHQVVAIFNEMDGRF